MASCFRSVAAKAIAAATVLGGGAALALGASVEQGCKQEPAAAAAPPPIVIGVSLGLTKDLDTFAAPLRDAVRVAEGEINAAGGLLGRPVVFDVQDDRSDEGDFVKSVAQDFVRKNVVAVIGPIGSQQVKLTQDIYAGAQIIQISPSATSTELPGLQQDQNRFFFRTTPDDAFQGAAVMSFAEETPSGIGDGGAPEAGPTADGGTTTVPATCSMLAIVNIDNAYGNAMATVIEKNWPKQAGPQQRKTIRKVLSTELAASYAAEAKEIIAQTPDCLVLISYEKTAAQFVRDFKGDPGYPDLEKKGFFFMGTDGVFTPGFLSLTLEDQSDPTSKNVAIPFYGTNPDTAPGTPEYYQFRTIFSSYFPLKATDDAPPFTANTFDAAMLIALAIQKAGTVDDRTRVRDALKDVANPPGRPVTPSQIADALVELRNGNDVDYKGASGPCDFASNGNVNAGFIVWELYRDPKTNKADYKTIERFSTEQLQKQIVVQ